MQSFPIYNPEARRGGSELIVRWLSTQPWHGPGPRGLEAETLSSSRGGQPTSCSGRNGTRLQKASACSVLGPSPHSCPPYPLALGHAPRTTARSLPPATWRGRSQSGTRGSCGAGEPGLHPKRLGDVARPQAGRNVRGRRGRSSPVLRTPQGRGSW